MCGYSTILSIFLSLHLGLLVYLSGHTNSKIQKINNLCNGNDIVSLNTMFLYK